ncbi:hypothetical protein AI2935V1_1563 [Citrobacter freundii]|uniref:DUF551 domain-containing protein n=1 Tax=Citrobacter freundii TaxID=546 RepID=A0AAD1TWJ4_CITFR|nr:hypothetical protein [Citrobacter freundii]CAF2787379.1 hypothetical protein AI2935V1_1563 [Citrobacter freundii]CAH6577338.1 hypothetical protein AI2935V1_1563 [Citrobacter freundii]
MTTNHPANGPVSLDRLHQIREILSKAAAQSDGGNLGYAMADAVKVIEGVIAARNVETIYQVMYGECWRDITEEQYHDHVIHESPIRIVYAAPPALVAPDECKEAPAYVKALTKDGAFIYGFNACRAAMLQAEPVSNSDELPLDYLQGHKDGLEWAAQMAEANHPQTGDWLYDDPIELARAIRKGPDMPEFKSVSVDEDDNFYSWFGRFWYENYQKNNYTTSAKQMLGTMAEFAYRAGRESAALAGNSPVTPDDWQLVPKEPTEAMNKAGWAAINEHDAINPTYRAMLAAAPQQEVK